MSSVTTRGLVCGYDGFRLEWPDTTLRAGEMTAVLGPNGSGKSTALRCLAGLLRPLAGAVDLDGRTVAAADGPGADRRALARSIAFMPQFTAVVFPFTAQEVVLMGRHPHLGRVAFEGANDRGIARSALERCGVGGLADRLFETLSGGEMQRVVLARALAQQAEVLVLDEPTAALDPANTQTIFSVLGSLADEGATVVLATHELQHTGLSADRALLLDTNGLLADGPPAEVLDAGNVHAAYGADVDVVEKDGRRWVVPTGGGAR